MRDQTLIACVLVTPPTSEPVTVAECKEHLRIEHDLDDALLALYVTAARRWIETYTQRQIMLADWRLDLEAFPREIVLPWPTLQAVTSITYTDLDGVPQTLAATEYQVSFDTAPARIKPAYSKAWPSARSGHGIETGPPEVRIYSAVRVAFRSGYGTLADVPEEIKTAIKQMTGHWYNYREPVVEGRPMPVPMHFESLLSHYRTYANDLAWVTNAA